MTIKEKYPTIVACDVPDFPGWYPIIEELCESLEFWDKKKEVTIVDIKIKFNSLRIYLNFLDSDTLWALVFLAERIATRTCPYCGKPKLSFERWCAGYPSRRHATSGTA